MDNIKQQREWMKSNREKQSIMLNTIKKERIC